MSIKPLLTVVALGLVVSCGQTAGPARGTASPPQAYRLFVAGQQSGLVEMEPGGRVVARLPVAVPAPGWDSLYAISPPGTLSALAPRTGNTQRTMKIPAG